MELLQLRYFFESAKNENFAQTAEKYMVPTSSVSAAVKRLEAELGEKLFDRTANRIALNEKGKRLQRALCVAFEELDNAVEAIRTTGEEEREINLLVRTIRGTITDYIIEYAAKYPMARFKAIYSAEAVDFENYDVIIDKSLERYVNFEKFELSTQNYTLKVAADSPLVGKKLTLRQLSSEPFITMGAQANSHKLLLEVCKRAGFTPHIVMQCNDVQSYVKCLQAGLGIGVSGEQITPGKTAVLDVIDFKERQVNYGYYKSDRNTGAVKRFVDFLKEKAKK